MSASLFGTDGIRGPFGSYPLDRATVTALGAVLGTTLTEQGSTPTVVLGGDSRESTDDLCRWLATGLDRAGVGVRYAGTVPTPAIAHLTRKLKARCGIAVSASHNPMPDNGIKLLDADGFKWTPDAESALEARLGAHPEVGSSDVELAPELDLVKSYLAHLTESLPGDAPLEGLEVVLDCANGAASAYAPGLFTGLGARVTALADQPDGRNINEGYGSTHPEEMASRVGGGTATLGVAFDGDADRALFADEAGKVRDGDAILYLWSRALADRDELPQRSIVATSMSNLGLEVALRKSGIEIVRCDVGDRVVVETMRDRELLLGGEQSGHIVHLGLATTGDGMLTALHVARLVLESGKPLSELLQGLPRFPQILQNVRVSRKPDLFSIPSVAAKAEEVEQRLGDEGRLVLRYSGTEPLARVMIEGPDQETIEDLAQQLIDTIEEEIGPA